MVQFTEPLVKLQPEQVLHVADLIQRQLGLIYNGDKLSDLERRLNHVLKEIPKEELDLTISRLLAGEFEQIPNLIPQLTIPETYFLRNIRLFKALKSNILPEIINRKKFSHQLNIWSAGCSSGEEPYSVSILLTELLGEKIDQWQINLIATDLNEKILQKARRAVYSEWSFRGVPPDFKARYFVPLHNGLYQLKNEIKKNVTFFQHNLIEGAYPPVASIRNFDIILCRNVLIYMSRSTVQNILEKFYRILDDDGYLITGPSEFPTLKNRKFSPVMLEGTIFYQKSTQRIRTQPPLRKESAKKRLLTRPKPKPAVKPRPIIPKEKSHFPLEIAKSDEKREKEKKTAADELSMIRKLADKGRLDEALELCERYVKRRPMDKNGHYLLGTVLMEKGDFPKAETAFRRTIYFDPNFVMAHFALANIYSITDKTKDARKHYTNVLRILERFDPTAPVPESEGMAASHFADMVTKLVNKS